MNSTTSQPLLPTTSYNTQHHPLPNIVRKQSAPAIAPSPITLAQSQHQQQFQQAHGSPSRARDRNLFDKVPSNQDVVQLPMLKGCLNFTDAHFPLFFSDFFFCPCLLNHVVSCFHLLVSESDRITIAMEKRKMKRIT